MCVYQMPGTYPLFVSDVRISSFVSDTVRSGLLLDILLELAELDVLLELAELDVLPELLVPEEDDDEIAEDSASATLSV